jgi:peroxiredoxin Q/BCP
MKDITLHITLSDQSSQEMSYHQLLSRTPYTILYFYPKDNTPGCSKQAHDFTTMNAEFVSL